MAAPAGAPGVKRRPLSREPTLALRFAAIAVFLPVLRLNAQDLTPRAYLITPSGSNAVTVSYSYLNGSVFTDPSVPVTDFKGHFHAHVLSYYHSFGFLGRSANVVASLPYGRGNFEATVSSVEQRVYRSGLADLRLRFALNIWGGPSITLKDFADWREKTILGVSLTAAVPTGQYDPAKLINPGSHRWAVKPELGFARRWGPWSLDLYAGAWFYSRNSKYYPGSSIRNQANVAAGEAHVTHNISRRCWLAIDGNFWIGGRSEINGVRKPDLQKNSRLGATMAIPLDRRQSLKFSYSAGSYISIGGNYQSISAAWQYSWFGRRP